jgi:hypothetical protein
VENGTAIGPIENGIPEVRRAGRKLTPYRVAIIEALREMKIGDSRMFYPLEGQSLDTLRQIISQCGRRAFDDIRYSFRSTEENGGLRVWRREGAKGKPKVVEQDTDSQIAA